MPGSGSVAGDNDPPSGCGDGHPPARRWDYAAALVGGIGLVGWVGLVGGIGLVVSSGFFPALGQDHPVIAIAGLGAVVGLTAFCGWVGVLLLRSQLTAESVARRVDPRETTKRRSSSFAHAHESPSFRTP